MKQLKYYILIPVFTLLGCFLYLLAAGEQDAAAVRQEVVRFHVVAKDNSTEAQQLKIKVRDGLFGLAERLFAPCTAPEEALSAAAFHRQELEEAAEQILRENGCEDAVTVQVGERYFPTKDYGALSFPAGRYQAVSVQIGAAKGENFWCVLYPALCIAPAVVEEQAEEEMIAAVGESGTAFLKKSEPVQKIKFALVVWLARWKEKICK